MIVMKLKKIMFLSNLIFQHRNVKPARKINGVFICINSLLMNVYLWKRNEDFQSSESNFLLIHKVWLGKSMQSHFTFFTVLHKCLTFCLRQVKKTIVKTKQAMTQSIWKPVSAICWFKSLTFYPRDLNTFTKPFFVYFEFLFFFALRNTNWKRWIFELLLFGAVV